MMRNQKCCDGACIALFALASLVIVLCFSDTVYYRYDKKVCNCDIEITIKPKETKIYKGYNYFGNGCLNKFVSDNVTTIIIQPSRRNSYTCNLPCEFKGRRKIKTFSVTNSNSKGDISIRILWRKYDADTSKPRHS